MRFRTVCLLLVLAATEGCSREGNPPPESIPHDYLRGIKAKVLQLERSARKNPAATASLLPGLIENLDESKYEKLGSHEPAIEKLKASVRELKKLYDASAPASQITQIIGEMATLANSLPGVVSDDA